MVCALLKYNGDCVANSCLVRGKMLYHNKSAHEVLNMHSSRESGLREDEILSRAGTKRKDVEVKRKSIVFKFLEQFFDLMIIILLLASFISITIGIIEYKSEEIVDGCIILAIVLMNAIFGVVQ